MRKKITVTIGIPAYNEEQNIALLLKALLKQKQTFFQLKKIILVSDNSNDETEKRVRLVRSKKVNLYLNAKRMGQMYCQNTITSLSSSDVLILMEADVLPSGQMYLNNLLIPFRKRPLNMVVFGNSFARKENHTFIGRVFANQINIYKQMLIKYDKESVCSGRGGKALSKDVYKKIKWVDSLPEDIYTLLWAKQKGVQSRFSKNAICYFQCSQTLSDYVKTRQKEFSGQSAIMKHLPKKLWQERHRKSPQFFLESLLTFLLKDPVGLFFYLVLKSFVDVNLKLFFQKSFNKNLSISTTTKRILN